MIRARWVEGAAISVALLALGAGGFLWLVGQSHYPGIIDDGSGSRAIRVWYSGLPLLAGVAFLGVGGWWFRATLGAALRTIAIPLASASAVPLLVAPIAAYRTPFDQAVTSTASVLASLILAEAVARLIASQRARRAARAVAVVAAVSAGLLGTAPLLPASWAAQQIGGLLALAVVPLAPVLLVTRSVRQQAASLRATAPGAGWLMAAILVPGLAIVARVGFALGQLPQELGLAAWIAVLVVWSNVDRRLAEARRERDLAVVTSEAERSRLAADLHDSALQELALLVRRLDTSGDAAAAEAARSVADRLRELCGELHLPILDEFGAGPALEWLVDRIAATSGDDVRLQRDDEGRPPPQVELAIFRVAQEALSNAAKHASPPILVRYASSATRASLSIEDSGPNVAAGDPIAPRVGHYGLATMQQRAEQIGGQLSIRPWAGGGTRVFLEWSQP